MGLQTTLKTDSLKAFMIAPDKKKMRTGNCVRDHSLWIHSIGAFCCYSVTLGLKVPLFPKNRATAPNSAISKPLKAGGENSILPSESPFFPETLCDNDSFSAVIHCNRGAKTSTL